MRTPSDTTPKALDNIGDLYGIEAKIRGKPLDELLRVRKEKAKPTLKLYGAWLKAKLETLSSKSEAVNALNYSPHQGAALIRPVQYAGDRRKIWAKIFQNSWAVSRQRSNSCAHSA